jgi:hypothetical protein
METRFESAAQGANHNSAVGKEILKIGLSERNGKPAARSFPEAG